MSGPFKMKGSSFYGHGNQKRENGMPYASPVKQTDIGSMTKEEWEKENKDFGLGWSGKEYYEQMNEPVVKGGKTTSGAEIKKSKAYKAGDYKDTRGTIKKGWDALTQVGQGIKGAFSEGKTYTGEFQREKTHDKIAGLQNIKASNKKASSGSETRKAFNKAFATADKSGKDTFEFRGKSYTTEKE